MYINGILFHLTDFQNLNRKQFNKLFPIKGCRIGLFSTNRRFLTTELIDKAITDGISLHTLYAYNANMLNEQQLINAVDKEIWDGEGDIDYLFDNRTKEVSDDFVEYCCGKVESLYGDDIEMYGNRIEDLLITMKDCDFINGKQITSIIKAIDEVRRVIEDYRLEMEEFEDD